MNATAELLLQGAKELGLSLNDGQLRQLSDFLRLIQKWNRAYNLVGVSDSHILVTKHLLDCLSVAPYINEGPVLDVGSGAGLPGIPLAIARPDISFILLDSNGKKTRFMRQAAIELELENIEVVHSRVQEYVARTPPKMLLSRAFAHLHEALQLLTEQCAPGGQVGIMLGEEPQHVPEISGLNFTTIHKLIVPGLNSQRHLLLASKI